MELSKSEINVLRNVLSEALWDRDIHKKFGGITIEEMNKLFVKFRYADYCERHGITFEEMTEDDFERAYFEDCEG